MKLSKNTTTQISAGSKSILYRIRHNTAYLLLCLPALICFFIWNYLPMFGLLIAFKDYTYADGILGSRWIGFENFKFFFLSNDAWRITRNTIGYGISFLALGIICSVIVALLLYELRSRIAIKFYQTAMMLPNFLSWVIVGFITYIVLNPVYGIANQILTVFGKETVDWYSDPKYWPLILTICNVWKGVGMSAIMYYASLMGIDQEMYEAATLDGANGLQKCWYISVPSLVPLMVTLGILGVGNILKGDFGLFYQIPRDVGALYPTTDIIDTYVYRGVRTGDLGVTSAVGFFQSVVGLILVFVTNKIVAKVQPGNELF